MKFYYSYIKTSMSVNIFGASKIVRGGGKKGERGIGFNLDSEDNFDIDNKRLVNVSEPIDEKDAATKSYVDEVKNELSEKDATTKSYVDEVKNELHESITMNLDTFTAEGEDFNTRLIKVEDDDGRINAEINAVKIKIAELDGRLKDTRDNYVTEETLSISMADVERRHTGLQNEFTSLQSKLTQLEEKIEGAETRNRARRALDEEEVLKQTITDHTNEIKRLSNSIRRSTIKFKALSHQVEQNKLDIVHIRYEEAPNSNEVV